MQETVAVVVPCFNEATRLVPSELMRLAGARPSLSLVLVDDGSTDGTHAALDALRRAAPDRISVLRLARNRGKAEAVREGMRAALAMGASVVGYCDADLSTPVDEVARLVDVMRDTRVAAVLGSRIRYLGAEIERRAVRHYLGRAFATLASLALRLPVYDTQCGAKLFRASAALERALAVPFGSRWIFDVEMLARLLDGGGAATPVPRTAVVEVPLRSWRDVGGSKLRLAAMLRAGLQLIALYLRTRRARAGAAPAPASETAGGGATAADR